MSNLDKISQMTENQIKAEIHQKLRNRLLCKIVFDQLIPLSDFLDFSKSTAIYCPFHDDKNHVSAKIYADDDDGIEKIWCYRCHRMYTAYNYVTKIEEQDPVLYLIKEVQLGVILQTVYEAEKGLLDAQKAKNGLQISKVDTLYNKYPEIEDFIEKIAFGGE